MMSIMNNDDKSTQKFLKAKDISNGIRSLMNNIEIVEKEMELPLDIAMNNIIGSLEPDISEVMAQLVKRLAPLCGIEIVDHASNPFGKLAEPLQHEEITELFDLSARADELRKELAEIMNAPPVKEQYTPVELTIEEIAPVVEEAPTETDEEPIAPTIIDGVTINLDGYDKPITVLVNGSIYVDNQKIEPFVNTKGYAFVKLPDGTRSIRMLQHKIVAMAYLGRPPKKGENIIHKNGNPMDCSVKNLAWKSTYHQEKLRVNESDAVDICIALIASYFNASDAVRYLVENKQRASVDYVRSVLRKETFQAISDRYFDEKYRIRRLPHCLEGKVDLSKLQFIDDDTPTTAVTNPTPEVVSTTETARFNKINNALINNEGDLLKTFEVVKGSCPDLTIYEIFNVKNVGKTVPREDIDILIRCARNSGSDIRSKIMDECGIRVAERDIARATRKMSVK